jgi:hypothetical protein
LAEAWLQICTKLGRDLADDGSTKAKKDRGFTELKKRRRHETATPGRFDERQTELPGKIASYGSRSPKSNQEEAGWPPTPNKSTGGGVQDRLLEEPRVGGSSDWTGMAVGRAGAARGRGVDEASKEIVGAGWFIAMATGPVRSLASGYCGRGYAIFARGKKHCRMKRLRLQWLSFSEKSCLMFMWTRHLTCGE